MREEEFADIRSHDNAAHARAVREGHRTCAAKTATVADEEGMGGHHVPPHDGSMNHASGEPLWRHTTRQIEPIGPGCWAVSTQTEDRHRFTAFSAMREQAMSRVYHTAKAYGHYADPTSAAPRGERTWPTSS